MPKVTIYHNPKCSKSRQALKLLEENGIKPTIIHYLEDHPTLKDLQTLLTLLKLKPTDIVRKTEKPYKELQLDHVDDDTLLQAMADFPILIERPIVVVGKKAAIGRPPENILEILP